MSHTYKDQARYRNKHRPFSEWLDPSSYSWYDESICMSGTRRKKYYRISKNRKLRHDWRMGLHKGDYESLPIKPENVDWLVW